MPKSSFHLEPRAPEWFDSDTPCLCFSIQRHSLSHRGHRRCSISFMNAPLLPPAFSFQPQIPTTWHIVRIVIWEKWRKEKKRAGSRLGESGYKFYLSFLCIYFYSQYLIIPISLFLGVCIYCLLFLLTLSTVACFLVSLWLAIVSL